VTQQPISVIFILGSGHCGSTLLDLLLDTQPGVAGLGEVTRLDKGERCTCGAAPEQCPYWSTVLPGIDGPIQCRRGKLAFFGNQRPPCWREAQQTNEALYKRAADAWQAQTLVDSSKKADHAELMSGGDVVTPVLVHLVRDGRAVTHSYMKKGHSFLGAAMRWVGSNIKTSISKWRMDAPAVTVHYDTLTKHPQQIVADTFEAVGCPANGINLAYGDSDHHEIGGNRMRFAGSHDIKPDTQWRADMPRRYQYLFTVLFGWLNWIYDPHT